MAISVHRGWSVGQIKDRQIVVGMVQGIIELRTNRERLTFQMVDPERNYALNRRVPILLIRANVGVAAKVPSKTLNSPHSGDHW